MSSGVVSSNNTAHDQDEIGFQPSDSLELLSNRDSNVRESVAASILKKIRSSLTDVLVIHLTITITLGCARFSTSSLINLVASLLMGLIFRISGATANRIELKIVAGCLTLIATANAIILLPRVSALTATAYDYGGLINVATILGGLFLISIFFLKTNRKVLALGTLLMISISVTIISFQFQIDKNRAYDNCRRIIRLTNSKDCFAASSSLNMTTKFLVEMPVLAVVSMIMAFMWTTDHESSHNRVLPRKKTRAIIAAVMLLACVASFCCLPKIAKNVLDYHSQAVKPELKPKARGLVSIKAKPGDHVSSLITLKLGGLDLSAFDIEFDREIYIESRNNRTVVLHSSASIIQITASKYGSYSRQEEINAEKDVRVDIALTEVRDESEIMVGTTSLTTMDQNGQTCTVDANNLYCPISRFDPDSGKCFYRNTLGWKVAAMDSSSIASRRVLQAQDSHIESLFTLESVHAKVRIFLDSHNHATIILSVHDLGTVVIKSDDFGIASQVHLRPFATSDRLASFYRKRSSDFIGRAVFSNGHSLVISKKMWQTFRKMSPVAIQPNDIAIEKLAFEHGVSVDLTYQNIEKANFYLAESENLARLIEETKSQGDPLILENALCKNCFQWIPKPLAAKIVLADKERQEEKVLLNIESLYRKTQQGKYTEMFKQWLLPLAFNYSMMGVTVNLDVLKSYISDHDSALSRDELIDIRSHELVYDRDVVEIYTLAKEGYMFALTKEELKGLVIDLHHKKYVHEPFVKDWLPFNKDNDLIETPYFIYRNERYQANLAAIQRFVDDPKYEPHLTYRLDSSVFKPRFMN